MPGNERARKMRANDLRMYSAGVGCYCRDQSMRCKGVLIANGSAVSFKLRLQGRIAEAEKGELQARLTGVLCQVQQYAR
jgi:hypothetical protein